MYELHIAAEVLSPARRAALFAALTAIGLTKNKLFYNVFNLITTVESCADTGTPPTGHDLDRPGSMSTVKVGSYAEACRIILAGMKVLAELGIEGNFEIERIITEAIPDAPPIDVAVDLPGQVRIQKAPLYENHVMWKGPRWSLPSVDIMNRFFVENFNVALHQVVDFGRDPVPCDTTIVSRVATIYQPTRAATLDFATRFASAPNTLGYRNPVAEQVVLVGKPA